MSLLCVFQYDQGKFSLWWKFSKNIQTPQTFSPVRQIIELNQTNVINPKKVVEHLVQPRAVENISQQMLLIVGGVGYLSRMLVQMLFNQICLPVARRCWSFGDFCLVFNKEINMRLGEDSHRLDDHPTLRKRRDKVVMGPNHERNVPTQKAVSYINGVAKPSHNHIYECLLMTIQGPPYGTEFYDRPRYPSFHW